MNKELLRSTGRSMYRDGYRFISQKWFHHGAEVLDINTKIMSYATQPLFDNELDSVKEIIRNSSSRDDQMGYWPPIVWPEVHGELPFPLTEKQLVIINRMIYHPMDNNGRNIFITTGRAGTGKSTFLNIIKQLHNNDFSSATLGDLSNRFLFANAVGHRLICSDELGCKDLDNDLLKRMATKDCVSVDPKFGRTYDIKSQANLFWCCNYIPSLDIKDSGLLRRIVFYEMDTPIANPDPSKAKHIFTPNELAIIATKAKEYDCDDWFEKYFENETKRYLIRNCSVCKAWADAYQQYCIYCDIDHMHPYNRSNWEEIKSVINEWTSKDQSLINELEALRLNR